MTTYGVPANRKNKKFHAKAVNPIPGDDLCEMTADHVDSTGKVWPKGTKFRPNSSGMETDGSGSACRYKMISIGGKLVKFFIG